MRFWIRSTLVSVAASLILAASPGTGQAESPDARGEVPEEPVSIREALSDASADVRSGRLMVLGSPHLAQHFDEEFEHEWLDELLDGLEDYAPEVIAIETLRPRDIHAMRQYSDRPDDWEMILDMFVKGIVTTAETIRGELDLDWGEARRRQAELLADFEAVREDPEARHELALMSFAAYDYHTGLLHWGALSKEQREAELDSETVADLDERLVRTNESVSIAVNLARELGHARVYPVDDQKSLAIQQLEEHEAIERTMEESSLREEIMKVYEDYQAEVVEASVEAGNLLPWYELYNSTEFRKLDLDTQWAVFFDERMDTDLGRTRMARREVRDLNIAANIREATARYPGEDALVVIGASHKAFLESYLSDMSDLDLVQPQEYWRER